MHRGAKRYTEWLSPVPEQEYLRILYVGKLQISSAVGDDHQKNERSLSSIEIELMIQEIWNVSKYWNKIDAISGHLSYTNEYHVAQLIEGRAEKVNSLMARIEKDPRVYIWKVFRKTLRTMNIGWKISMCYSFEITSEQYKLVADDNVSPEQMFNSMKNTYEALLEGWKVDEFYRTTVETFLLKFISVHEKVKLKRR